MARKWGATGVGDEIVPRLSSSRREQLELVLNGEFVANDGREEFLDALATAVAQRDQAIGVPRKLGIMGDEDQRGPLAPVHLEQHVSARGSARRGAGTSRPQG